MGDWPEMGTSGHDGKTERAEQQTAPAQTFARGVDQTNADNNEVRDWNLLLTSMNRDLWMNVMLDTMGGMTRKGLAGA